MEKEKKDKTLKKIHIYIFITVAAILTTILVLSVIVEDDNMKAFNDCLADEGMVIYGSDWCPACSQLVEMLGGYEAVSSVYVECTEEQQKCQQEMIGTGVPEIQIDGEMYEGARELEALGKATGCELPE